MEQYRDRHTQAIISRQNLAHNFSSLRALIEKDAFFCPMVKADAYGHGAFEVAKLCQSLGAHAVGVVLIEEGIALRQQGYQGEVLVFGLFKQSAVELIERFRLTPVVSHLSQIDWLADSGNRVAFHLKINTGMNRLGFAVRDLEQANEKIKTYSHLRLKGLCSHLIEGEDLGSSLGFSDRQVHAFVQATKAFETSQQIHLHLWNSSALAAAGAKKLFAGASTVDGHVLSRIGARPGIALYGVGIESGAIDLKPAMKLTSEIALVRRVHPDETVSYGGTWRAIKESHIGIVPMGYADGYCRQFSNRAWVNIGATTAPVVGRVCMDHFMIDLSEVPEKHRKMGTEIVLFGGDSGPKVDALAALADTISYEVLTGISERVPREYVD